MIGVLTRSMWCWVSESGIPIMRNFSSHTTFLLELLREGMYCIQVRVSFVQKVEPKQFVFVAIGCASSNMSQREYMAHSNCQGHLLCSRQILRSKWRNEVL